MDEFVIQVSDKEYEWLSYLANASGLSCSEFIRLRLLSPLKQEFENKVSSDPSEQPIDF